MIVFICVFQSVVVTDADIKRQEQKVLEARKRLEGAMTALRDAEIQNKE